MAKKPELKIAGGGPDAETVTNDQGAKQSHVPYRLDLLPAEATWAKARDREAA